ncbi:MAG TPA: FAD-dependent oxidoreductase [Gemmatimonadaceae bacterium]|nr:FAD-dependent oxidoreductase [Gemmatimonadaceae bacterium]
MSDRRIAVLGAGMLGCCTALELARRGQRVTLVDRAHDVMQRASRWNEGKIHLGFLYPADPSRNTAARLIPGALAFKALVKRLTGRSLDALASDDDVYMIHRRSVVDAEAYAEYADSIADMIADAARAGQGETYLRDLRSARVHRLSGSELADLTASDQVVAGFRVPERSVSTVAVADAIAAAVRAEPLIEVNTGVQVRAVCRRDDGRFDVTSEPDGIELSRFDRVVNALWEGRPVVDAAMGITPPAPWSHRLRAAIYAKAKPSAIRGATVCTGPFGDIKQYGDGRLYLSWYEAGLLAQGSELAPPLTESLTSAERLARVRAETFAALSRFFPDVARVEASAESIEVHAGWVYAIGRGSLADRASALHRRDQFTMTEDRGYISVDTGKYSMAPWLAEQVAVRICA